MNDVTGERPFESGNIVTVTNEKDIMYGLQGEVAYCFFDDLESFSTLALVKFHKGVVGERGQGLRLVGDYYEGIRSPKGPMKFAYQDRSPKPSSIRVDANGYTEENKQKLGLG